MTRDLYYGDNLVVLRESIADASVDLIYLDPPFNSKRDYNLLFKSPTGHESDAQITAFEDTWHWGGSDGQAEREYHEILSQPNTNVADMIRAFVSFLGRNDVMAYLVMMANRLLELHRVLKPTGSLYLHCDPTASHYLKVVMDAVFGKENFQNEIVWQRTAAKALMSRRLPNNHDLLFSYHKTESSTWNLGEAFVAYDESNLDDKTARKYSHKDADGRLYRLDNLINPNQDRPNLTYEFLGITRVWRWTKERMQAAYDAGLVIQTKPGTVPQLKRYLDDQRGRPVTDVWTDIPPINSQAQERLGYPTQKPLALLERIIQTSSNTGDIVLDPFCGCGTAVHAAEKLARGWIGIDITHLAVSLIEKRLRDAFPTIEFTVHGTPKDLEGAHDLATRDKYQFQWWACSLVNAQPYQGKKKGADSGIDGLIFFEDDNTRTKKIIVSVKGGDNVNVGMIRDLVGVIEREKAEIGLFVTLTPPTKPMLAEAASAGFYRSPFHKEDFPRIQILTVEDLLAGHVEPKYANISPDLGFKRAKREVTAHKGHVEMELEE